MSRPDWAVDGRDWPNRAASQFVEINGARWHVQITEARASQKPAILLIHGTGAATHSWRDVMPLLSPHFTVVAMDLPGHGFTRAAGMASLPAMAEGISALLDHLEIRPAFAVGHSAGAAILVRMALDAMLDTQAIVALNGALLPFPGVARQLFPAMARGLFVNPFVPRLLSLQARAMGDLGGFLSRVTGSKLDRRGTKLYERLFARSGHVEGALAMMANWDLDGLAAALPKLTTPLTLIAGENDKSVPPYVSQRVVRLVPHGDLVLLPGLGHLAHEEAPAQIAEIVIRVASAYAIRPSGEGDGE